MKLATFVSPQGEQLIGCVDTDTQTVLELQSTHRRLHGVDSPYFSDMLALIDGGDEGLALARKLQSSGSPAETHPLSSVKLLSPVPVPRQIRDFNNAEEHMRNAPAGIKMMRAKIAGEPVPKRSDIAVTVPDVNFAQPIFYISNRFNVVGQDAEIQWPGYSEWLDYEAEFGFFVGKTGKDISKTSAAAHIFGYSVFNDFSARDKQIREMEGSMGPTKGKSFDTGNAIGPWIVTRDEIADSRKLAVAIRVNGEVWGKSSTSTMIHSFEDMLAYISENETIYAGEFFGSGTMAGGCSLECDRWMKDGDVIEIEFENIGTLRNRVVRSRQ